MNIKSIHSTSIKAQGPSIYIEFELKSGDIVPAKTLKGDIKHWSTFDTAIKYLKNKGIHKATIDIEHWNKQQQQLDLGQIK